ncbi:hypothetical protein L596_008246 [Steinernema carpocapsae]|uniref:Uncharacterized protein n=1 Tax=Steinernema carpocapsae TaxID=34508 RepID=A0A4U5PCF1_STECR|nr:hypothetical protein L596_008246 [Steinernema carpocapsae]
MESPAMLLPRTPRVHSSALRTLQERAHDHLDMLCLIVRHTYPAASLLQICLKKRAEHSLHFLGLLTL